METTNSEPLKIQPLEKVGYVGGCCSSPSDYIHRMPGYTYRKPTSDRIAEYALQQLEAARQKDIEAHQANLPKIEVNKAIQERIESLMQEVGMPKSWSEPDRKSRARFPRSITHNAGYITDLMREVKTSDGFAGATSSYESLKKRYSDYATSAAQEAKRAQEEQERAQEAAKAERRANLEMAGIILRYSLGMDADWGEILAALRSRDKYLDMAVAMENVRGDWSEGPGEVRDALDRFTIETDRDKEIANDTIDGLTDFCDGRVFRDCRWSYDALYGIIEDQQLVADARLARDKMRGY